MSLELILRALMRTAARTCVLGSHSPRCVWRLLLLTDFVLSVTAFFVSNYVEQIDMNDSKQECASPPR